jgi:hypothetical protein
MMMQKFKVKIRVRTFLTCFVAVCLLAGLTPVMPAGAQVGVPLLLGKPAIAQATAQNAEKKKEGAPPTCGPIITDACLPIDTGKFSVQVTWALSFYMGNYSPNWRYISAGGDFYTLYMPVKFTYGVTKDMEVYVVIPFVTNWAKNVNTNLAGPNGERSASYSGIGDMTLIGKYNLLAEGDFLPAVSAVAGFATIPTGHASRLNPGRLLQDAVGTGSLSFTTGVNLFKYLKPFLVHSQIWMNNPVNIYKIRGEDNPQNVRNHDWVNFNLAVEYPFTKDKKWIFLMEMYSSWTWSNIYTTLGFQSPVTLLGVQPAIEYVATDKLSLAAGAAFDLVGKFNNRKFTPVVTVLYTF